MPKKTFCIPRIIITVLLLCIALVLGYVLYVTIQYHRIADNTVLAIEGESSKPLLEAGKRYTAATYNIGFGAYDPDFSFFMDTGTMQNGTPVKGTYGKAISKENVLQNMNGIIATVKKLSADIVLFQEVDKKSNRAHGVNEKMMLQDNLPGRNTVYASNFHTAYLAYPLSDPHGKTEAGLLTMSAHPVAQAVRRSYPVDNSFPNRFFDLDRCFSVSILPVTNGKHLILINSHMSAYDKGGIIRKKQLEMLNAFMKDACASGDYVIVGGDFNHSLGGDILHAFPTKQLLPEWVHVIDDGDITEGMRIVKAENRTTVPTCRSTDIPYKKGVNYTAVLDGFLVSDNVSATATDIDNEFAYSDHQPVVLTFTLEP